MDNKTTINTSSAPAAIGPYSQGIKSGNLLFTSGQLGIEPSTGKLISPELAPQVVQALQNLEEVIKGGGGEKNSIIKTTLFVKDMGRFSEINSIYADFFGTHKPARSTVEVARLPMDALFEIEAIAAVK